MKRFLLVIALFVSGATPQVRHPGPGGQSLSGGSVSPGTYSHEYTITLGNSSHIPVSQTNFTMLICANMTLGNGNACATATGLEVTGSGGYITNSSGYDIAFSSTSCSAPTLLKWEMPTYTGSSGAMEAWVGIPSLSASEILYMCVGNSAVTTFQGGGVGGAWDSNTITVWHLPNGSTLSYTDSSAAGNTGTPANSPTATAGLIAGGASLTATGSETIIGLNTVNIAAATISAWINQPSTPGSNSSLAGFANGGSYDKNLYLDSSARLFFDSYGGPTSTPSSSIPLNTWTYVAGTVVSGTGAVAYVNGVSVGTASSGGSFAGYGGPNIGINQSYGSTYNTLKVDELHVSSAARSANWLLIEFNNQSAPGSFMSVSLTY